MCPLAADATDTRIMFGSQVAFCRFTTTATNLRIESGAAALANSGAPLGSYTRVKFLAVFLPGCCSASARGFGAGARAGLATGGCHVFLLGCCSSGFRSTTSAARACIAHILILSLWQCWCDDTNSLHA